MAREAVIGHVTAPVRPNRRARWRWAGPVLRWTPVAGIAVYAMVRGLGVERTWPLDTLVAFTPYVALASIVLVIVAALLRDRWMTGVAAVSSVVLALLVVPRAIGGPDPGDGPVLRVMSSNMEFGAADPATLLRLVRAHHVDLLALEEFTPAARDALLAAGLAGELPYRRLDPVPATAYGSAIFSRYPLTRTGSHTMPGGYLQSYATVLVPGAQPVSVEAVHAAAPISPSWDGPWRRSLSAEPAATPDGQVRLLLGDFNATLDHAGLRALRATGYQDVADVLGDGLTPTWPYDGRALPPITLDHVFIDPRIGAESFGAATVPGTDHRAIYATLTLPPA